MPQFKSIKTKFVLFMIFLIWLSVVVFLIIVIDLDKRRLSKIRDDNESIMKAVLQSEWEDKSRAIAGLLSNRLIQPMHNFDIFEMKNLIMMTMEGEDINYIYVQDSKGLMIVAGVKEAENRGAEMMGRMHNDGLTKKALEATDLLVQRQGNIVEIAAPVMLGRKKLATARAGFSTNALANNISAMIRRLDDDLRKAVSAAIKNIFISSVAVGVPLVLLVVFFANRMVKPINRLIDGTKNIAMGNLDYRIETGLGDEIGRLADSFNKMTEDIQRYQREKEKMLKDMHDGIGGITTNIKLLSELAQKKSSMRETKEALKTISALSQEGLSEIRGFMRSLDIKDISWQDIAAELRSLGSSMIEPHGLSFKMGVKVEDINEQPNSLLYFNIFRTYKEALTNIIKHSKAKGVDALFSVNKAGIILSVKDDGIGLKEKEKVAGRGITNMIMRSRELGGQLTIAAAKGTQIALEIPIPIKYLSS